MSNLLFLQQILNVYIDPYSCQHLVLIILFFRCVKCYLIVFLIYISLIRNETIIFSWFYSPYLFHFFNKISIVTSPLLAIVIFSYWFVVLSKNYFLHINHFIIIYIINVSAQFQICHFTLKNEQKVSFLIESDTLILSFLVSDFYIC